MKNYRKLALATAVAAATMAAGAANATMLQFEFTNNSASEGLYLTPFLSVFHDGTYDAFNAGATASAGIEAIAEEGDVSVERAAAEAAGFTTAVAANAAGFPGAPVIDPGETASFVIDLDPTSERFISFFSMVIPSNDIFIGTNNPTAYSLFDAAGNFSGIGPIEILGGDVYDAGTEENNGLGAPFSADGGTATDTPGGVISLGPDLSVLAGITRPAGLGPVITTQGASDLLATVTVTEIAPVPLPAGGLLLLGGLAAMGGVLRRRSAS